MIDLTKLTQEQRWGLAYANKLANEATASSGDQENPVPALTDGQYAEKVFRAACDSYYANLIAFKKKLAMEVVDSLSPAQQDALLAQLNVPDVLPQV